MKTTITRMLSESKHGDTSSRCFARSRFNETETTTVDLCCRIYYYARPTCNSRGISNRISKSRSLDIASSHWRMEECYSRLTWTLPLKKEK
jgi:hypothetical protein